MRDATCIEVQATPEARLAYLLRDYADLGEDREALAQLMAHFKEAQGKATVQRWQDWARAGELPALFDELMRLHYDPHYERSQARHFRRWEQRLAVPADDLSEAALDDLARRVLAAASPSVS